MVRLSVEQVSPKQDVIFMITKMGYLFMFDIHSGKTLYRAKISEQTIFVTTTQVRYFHFFHFVFFKMSSNSCKSVLGFGCSAHLMTSSGRWQTIRRETRRVLGGEHADYSANTQTLVQTLLFGGDVVWFY